MITVELNQTILRGGQRFPAVLAQEVVNTVGRRLKQKGPYHVSVAFVSGPAIRRANRDYRGKDRVTDVLSFSLTPQAGELLLSFDQAKKQAKAMKHSVRNEIIFLLVHGMLHLFGHDHEKEDEAKHMFSHQEAILKKFHVNPRLTYD
ncbi:MAG: rRNA maturation RNase YbeY [Patescibacteria group bacterium]|mgnify:CR=1 FL=1